MGHVIVGPVTSALQHGVSKYAKAILQCFQKNSISLNPKAELDETLPSQAK